MTARAFITGIAGLTLTPGGALVPARARPVGPDPIQAQHRDAGAGCRLTSSFREVVGRDAPVLVDQEGGRVQRLGPPHWPRLSRRAPSTAVSTTAMPTRAAAAHLGARLIAADLAASASMWTACRSPTCRWRAPTRSSATAPTARRPRRSRLLARCGRRRAAGGGVLPVAQAHSRARPGDGRQPRRAAGGRGRPRDAGGDRFRRIPAARRSAARNDRPCRVTPPSILLLLPPLRSLWSVM